jgi:hypothetical protein
MRHLSRTVAVAVAGFAVLFAVVGSASVAWAAPAEVSSSGRSAAAYATSGTDMDPAMPGMPGMSGMPEATGTATPGASSGSMPGMADDSMPGMTSAASVSPQPAMPGMGTGAMPGMSPAPASASPSGSMAGMDDSSMPEMADTGTDPDAAVVSRPRTLVLGGFGVFNAGVLVAAALVRRRTASERDRRAARRAAGRVSGTAA